METDTWLIYLLAAIGLSLSPGPNGLLALTHVALHGRRKALYTVTGGCVGFVTIIALSMFGIGALLQASLVWLTVLKWVGGAYLVWLGIQVWRSPPIGIDMSQRAGSEEWRILFRQGALSAITNEGDPLLRRVPAAVHRSGREPRDQFVVMAGTFAVTEFVTEVFI
jgi:threonine/homoserine/homoserine lactone efflux protein